MPSSSLVVLQKQNHAFRAPGFFSTWFRRLTNWETWPWLIKYIPLIPAWISYCWKCKSFWFFTTSNPMLTFGGFDGERKTEMYRLLPEGSFPTTVLIKNGFSFSDVMMLVETHALQFPLAVKPDVGRMGLLFRKIETIEQLKSYHQKVSIDYVIQKFIDYPLEVSVFYYRLPDHNTGTITGFVRKDYLDVEGDGESTLQKLILNHPRAGLRANELFLKHAAYLNDVVPRKQRFCLSHALNLSRGGKLVSLEHEKDDSLLSLFDDLSWSGQFYYGRYDIRCRSIDDLKRRKNFYILEFNGSGAEPHHVYAMGATLHQAILILRQHWDTLCEIAAINYKRGLHYWTFKRGWQHMMKTKAHLSYLKKLDRDPNLLSSSGGTVF